MWLHKQSHKPHKHHSVCINPFIRDYNNCKCVFVRTTGSKLNQVLINLRPFGSIGGTEEAGGHRPRWNPETGLNSHLASISPRAPVRPRAAVPISGPAGPIRSLRLDGSFPKPRFRSPYSLGFGRSWCVNSASWTPRLCPPCSASPPSTNGARPAAELGQSSIELRFRELPEDQLESKNVLAPPESDQSETCYADGELFWISWSKMTTRGCKYRNVNIEVLLFVVLLKYAYWI